jgi:hypothetical protein
MLRSVLLPASEGHVGSDPEPYGEPRTPQLGWVYAMDMIKAVEALAWFGRSEVHRADAD